MVQKFKFWRFHFWKMGTTFVSFYMGIQMDHTKLISGSLKLGKTSMGFSMDYFCGSYNENN